MKQQDLRNFISPTAVDLGILDAGQDASFEIKNTTPYPILGYKRSCGCLGEIIKSEDGSTLSCALKASQGSGKVVMVEIDGELYQTYLGAKTQYFSPRLKRWLEKEITEEPTQVEVQTFRQSITIILDDGQPETIIDATGEIKDNPDKLKFVVPVSFLYK